MLVWWLEIEDEEQRQFEQIDRKRMRSISLSMLSDIYFRRLFDNWDQSTAMVWWLGIELDVGLIWFCSIPDVIYV
jgi:hypothetical protein